MHLYVEVIIKSRSIHDNLGPEQMTLSARLSKKIALYVLYFDIYEITNSMLVEDEKSLMTSRLGVKAYLHSLATKDINADNKFHVYELSMQNIT